MISSKLSFVKYFIFSWYYLFCPTPDHNCIKLSKYACNFVAVAWECGIEFKIFVSKDGFNESNIPIFTLENNPMSKVVITVFSSQFCFDFCLVIR